MRNKHATHVTLVAELLSEINCGAGKIIDTGTQFVSKKHMKDIIFDKSGPLNQKGREEL